MSLKFNPWIWVLLTASSVVQAANTPLFVLERSSNANQVIYELVQNGSSETIHPYWKMLAKRGQIEELTTLEKRAAYGVEIQSQKAGSLRFIIKPLPSYPITVATQPAAGHPYATVRIQGKARVLKRIYLHLTDDFMPKVKSLDLEVQPVEGGAPEYFKLTPGANGAVNEAPVRCTRQWTPPC